MTRPVDQTLARQQTRFADVLGRLEQELVSGRRNPDGSPALPGLPGLRARTTDDFTVAVADAWAALAEILGFHSARHDLEARLDLATELRSLVELSRLVGYQPDPGLAASAALAFVIDDAGAAPQAPVPVGTAVTSVPPPGQTAVTFETVETINGRPSWNLLLPRLTQPQTFDDTPTTVRLAGAATTVAPGDGLLVPSPNGPVFGIVTAVAIRPDDPPIPGVPGRSGWTTLTVTALPGETKPPSGEQPTAVSFDSPQPAPGPLLTQLSPGGSTTIDSEQLQAAATNGGFATADVFAALEAARAVPRNAWVFRARTAIFGSSAPDRNLLPADVLGRLSGAPTSGGTFRATGAPVWADGSLATFPGAVGSAGTTKVFCDAVVGAARTGTPIVLRDGGTWRVLMSTAAAVASLSVFTVSGRSTVLTLPTGDLSAFSIRGTSVFLAAEPMRLADADGPSTVPADDAYTTIELDDWVDGLAAGQRIAVTGLSATHPGLPVAHVTTLSSVAHLLAPTGSTTLELVEPLPDRLLRGSVRINANVAAATNGESRSEVLGSASGQDPRPSFTLSGSPLTYLPDAGGSSPALTVWVDGLSRDRVPALLDPDEPGYTVRQDDQQQTTIQFGSPLPTGTINVRADYRVGLGAGAGVPAGALSMLASRPPGVRAVTNPLPAAGGADPETIDEARRNAPVSVRALGRVVSLGDYADFARAYPGIAKARARAVAIADRAGVEVSVVGARGGDVTTASDLYRGLLAAFAAGGDELVPVRLLSCQRVPVQVGADLRIDPARIADDVLAAAQATLTHALSFDERDLGQPVSASEIVEVLQGVPGVVAATVTTLLRLVGGAPEDSIRYRPVLAASPPVGAPTQAAVLLTLDPVALSLRAVAL